MSINSALIRQLEEPQLISTRNLINDWLINGSELTLVEIYQIVFVIR